MLYNNMSKNLKIKKIKDGNNYKTLIITNNDKNKKFSLRNVKKIYNKLMLTNNLKEEDIQIDLKNMQRAIQIKQFENIYDDDAIDEYYSNKMRNYQNFTEFHEIIFRIHV
jgi:hypothetical protein